MVDPRIMVRELIAAYPGNTFFHDFVYSLNRDTLHQLYSTIAAGGKLIQTVAEWDAIPRQMGWDNCCR